MFDLKQNQIFRKFLFSNIFIFFIPLLIGIVAYGSALNVVVRDARELSMLLLDQASTHVDQRLAEVDSFVTFLSTTKKTSDIMGIQDPYEQGSVQKIFDLKEYISVYSVTNNFISTVYVHFAENDMLISPYASHTSGHSFYGNYFRYGDMSVSDWYQNILGTYHFKEYLPVTNVSAGADQSPMLIYLQSIPVSRTRQTKGSVLVLMDPAKISTYLEPLNVQKGGWAFITDAKNNLITTLSAGNIPPVQFEPDGRDGSSERVLNGHRMIVVQKTSPNNGWHYVSVQPYETAMHKVESIRFTIYVILLVSLLFSLIAAFYMAYRNSKPLRELLLTLQTRIGPDIRRNASSYDALNQSVSTILSDNDHLKETVRQQQPYLQAMLYEQLLRSGFAGYDELEALLGHVGISQVSIREKSALACIVRLNMYPGQVSDEILQEMGVVKAVVKEYFSRMPGPQVFMLDTDFDKIALILAYDSGQISEYTRSIETHWEHVSQTLLDTYNCQSFLACGSLRNSLLETGSSFEEAKRALDHRAHHAGRNLIWYSDCPTDNKEYYYSLEVEMRLIGAVKSGESDTVASILDSLRHENFEVRTLSQEMLRHLIYDMKGTVIKLVGQLNFNTDSTGPHTRRQPDDHSGSLPPDEAYTHVKQSFITLCHLVVQEKNSSSNQLRDQLTDYIRRNYADPQLSLRGLSNTFSLTEAFLTQFFKVHTGLSFSDYVESCRMEQAGILLSSSDLTINEVAEQLGYNSPHSFRRAFKRVNGVTPAEYREQVRGTR